MQKFDLHIVSIPDYRAQVEIAQIIAASNRTISMQTAMDMARNPPLQLCHDLDMAEAESYKDKLNKMGVGFRFSQVKSASASPDDAGAADSLNEFAGIKEHNESVKKDAPAAEPPPPAPRVPPAGAKTGVTAGAAGGGFSGFGGVPVSAPHASNLYHRDFTGVRIGSVDSDLKTLKAQEKAAKRKSLLVTIAGAAFVALVGYIIYASDSGGKKFGPDKQQAAAAADAMRADKSKQKAKKGGAAQQRQQQASAAPAAQPEEEEPASDGEAQRSRVNSQQKLQANNYVDSARAEAGNNADQMIAFYRIAISFNRYNLAAWQGLLQAYRDKEMTKEAQETEKQMNALFGEKVMSVSSLIKSFGDAVDAYLSEKGTYRVEYKSLKRTRADLINEVFTMTRSVRSACGCEDITIVALTGPQRGVLVHSTPSTSVHTLSAFQSQAEITWLD